MDSFFPDVLTFPDDGLDNSMDGSFNAMSPNQAGYFAQQGGFNDTTADLSSFFPSTGLTPLGTPGIGMFGMSQGFSWSDPVAGYSIPPNMHQNLSLDPLAAGVMVDNNTTTKDPPPANCPLPTVNAESPAEDLTKPKRGRPRKKRDKKQLSVEEENAKRQKFLERNRLAASKCRDRKKNWTQDTMDKLAREEKKHVDLQMEFSRLQAECANLMEAACQHIGHCEKNDGFQAILAQSSQRFASIVQAYSEAVGAGPHRQQQEPSENGEEIGTPSSGDEPPEKRARIDSITDESVTDTMAPSTPEVSNREIRALKRNSATSIRPEIEEDLAHSSRMSRQGSANSFGSGGVRDSGISSLGSPVKALSLSPTDEGFFGFEDRKPTAGALMMPNPRVVVTPQVKLEALLRARNFSNSDHLSQNVTAPRPSR